jgi:hypothetical protein
MDWAERQGLGRAEAITNEMMRLHDVWLQLVRGLARCLSFSCRRRLRYSPMSPMVAVGAETWAKLLSKQPGRCFPLNMVQSMAARVHRGWFCWAFPLGPGWMALFFV